MIYTTFKQWVKGRFLETGEPRKQAYSKDELALIEMGWGYGYDAGVAWQKGQQALDKKSENAFELGLDYEPDAPKESVRLQCTTCGTVYAEGVPPQVQQPAALEAKDEPVEFFDWYDNAQWGNEDFKEGCHRAWNAAIKYTAKPNQEAKDEPVAWLTDTGSVWKSWGKDTDVPLYTTPPQRTWVGLTDEEIQDLIDVVDHYNFPEDLITYTQAKLKELNT